MNLEKAAAFLGCCENRNFFEKLRVRYPYSINETACLVEQNPQAPIRDLLTLIRLQKKNKVKNPYASQFIFDEKGIEQSSSWELARYHGKKAAKSESIADLCCGIGMDLVHLATNKEKVIAVDSDKDKLIAARFNATSYSQASRIHFFDCNAEDFSQKVDAIFIDPDRRFFAKRIIEPEMMSPPLSAILKLTAITPHLMIKLSPAFAYQKLRIENNHTLEFISEKGSLKEILLCLGDFADRNIQKKAVLLDKKIELDDSYPVRQNVSALQTYLFEPDAAIIRSGLLQQCAQILQYDRVHEQIALLTGTKIVPTALGSYYLIEEAFSYRLKRLQAYLKVHKIGVLDIKTRGFPIPVETFRKSLKLQGKNAKTLFIIRLADRHLCVFCKRIKEKPC